MSNASFAWFTATSEPVTQKTDSGGTVTVWSAKKQGSDEPYIGVLLQNGAGIETKFFLTESGASTLAQLLKDQIENPILKA